MGFLTLILSAFVTDVTPHRPIGKVKATGGHWVTVVLFSRLVFLPQSCYSCTHSSVLYHRADQDGELACQVAFQLGQFPDPLPMYALWCC